MQFGVAAVVQLQCCEAVVVHGSIIGQLVCWCGLAVVALVAVMSKLYQGSARLCCGINQGFGIMTVGQCCDQ